MLIFRALAGLAARRCALWRTWLAAESGQDLIEYGLMAGFVGIAGYVVLTALGVDIFNTYQSWIDPSAGMPSLWDPPDPMGGGS